MTKTAVAQRVQRISAASRRFEVPPSDDLIELSKGEPDLDTPAPVIEAMVEALHNGWTHYGNAQGDPELRAAIAADAAARHGSTVTAADVLLTHGGAGAITSTMLALVDDGDVVVCADPSYSLYRDAVALAGGVLREVPVLPGDERAGLLRLAAQAIEDRAVLILLCNPVNPSGAAYSAAQLRAFAEILDGTDIRVLVDEAYEAYIYTDGSFGTALGVPELADRLLFCQTFSKTYAMTGWRLGYLMSHDTAALQAIGDVHKTFNGTLNAAVQRAALAAVRTRDETVPAMLADYRERRTFVMERLREIPGVDFVEPDGAFYVFFGYDFAIPSVEMRDRLVSEFGVALRPGTEFGDGGEHQLRLSYTSAHDDLSRGIDRIAQAFATIAQEQRVTVS